VIYVKIFMSSHPHIPNRNKKILIRMFDVCEHRYLKISGNFPIICVTCAVIILCGVTSTIGYFDDMAFGKASSTINSAADTTTSDVSSTNVAIDKLNFISASGTVASLQNDASGRPTWILSGQWHMLVLKPSPEESKLKPATVAFNTTFQMVGIDGAALHSHTISSIVNLTNITNSVNNNTHLSSTTINGTTRLAPVGLLNMIGGYNVDVPVSIKIIDQSTFSLWIDPNEIGYHFGNTPIYGIVTKKSG
jgi:hypothetical protein